jgi:LuxR family maltose regulon positive regulatory protein
LLKDYTASAEAAGRGLALVELRLLEAISDHKLGNRGAAIRRLGRAFIAGQRGAMVRIFADESSELRPLFMASVEEWAKSQFPGASSPDHAYVAQIAKAMGISIDSSKTLKTAGQVTDINVECLSGRENEVLHLVAEGTTNKAIAARLGVAESTVAWHLKNIYGKLEVNNRTAALAVARRNALLD